MTSAATFWREDQPRAADGRWSDTGESRSGGDWTPESVRSTLGGDGHGTTAENAIVRQSKDWLDGLTHSERHELTQYSGTAYQPFNQALKRCPDKLDCLDEKQHAMYSAIQSAILKAPAFDKPVTVYRGLQSYGHKQRQYLEHFRQAMATGDTVQLPGIVSLTTDPNVAVAFSEQTKEKQAGGFALTGNGLVLSIKAKSGAYVSPLSGYAEHELLHNHQTKYRVVGIHEDAIRTNKPGRPQCRHTVVELEQLDNGRQEPPPPVAHWLKRMVKGALASGQQLLERAGMFNDSDEIAMDEGVIDWGLDMSPALFADDGEAVALFERAVAKSKSKDDFGGKGKGKGDFGGKGKGAPDAGGKGKGGGFKLKVSGVNPPQQQGGPIKLRAKVADVHDLHHQIGNHLTNAALSGQWGPAEKHLAMVHKQIGNAIGATGGAPQVPGQMPAGGKAQPGQAAAAAATPVGPQQPPAEPPQPKIPAAIKAALAARKGGDGDAGDKSDGSPKGGGKGSDKASQDAAAPASGNSGEPAKKQTAEDKGGRSRLVPKEIVDKNGRKRTVMVKPDGEDDPKGRQKGSADDDTGGGRQPAAQEQPGQGQQQQAAADPNSGRVGSGQPLDSIKGYKLKDDGSNAPKSSKIDVPSTEEQANAVLPYKVKTGIDTSGPITTTSGGPTVDAKALTKAVQGAVAKATQAAQGIAPTNQDIAAEIAKALGRPLTPGETDFVSPARPGQLVVQKDGSLIKQRFDGYYHAPDKFGKSVFVPTPQKGGTTPQAAATKAAAGPSGSKAERPVNVVASSIDGKQLYQPTDKNGNALVNQSYKNEDTARLAGQAAAHKLDKSKLDYDPSSKEWVVSQRDPFGEWQEQSRYDSKSNDAAEHHFRLALQQDLQKHGVAMNKPPEAVPVGKHETGSVKVGGQYLFHAKDENGNTVGELYQNKATADLASEALNRGLVNSRMVHNGDKYEVQTASGKGWKTVGTFKGDQGTAAEKQLRKCLADDIAKDKSQGVKPAVTPPANASEVKKFYDDAHKAAHPWETAAKHVAASVLSHATNLVRQGYNKLREKFGDTHAKAIVASGFSQEAAGQKPPKDDLDSAGATEAAKLPRSSPKNNDDLDSAGATEAARLPRSGSSRGPSALGTMASGLAAYAAGRGWGRSSNLGGSGMGGTRSNMRPDGMRGGGLRMSSSSGGGSRGGGAGKGSRGAKLVATAKFLKTLQATAAADLTGRGNPAAEAAAGRWAGFADSDNADNVDSMDTGDDVQQPAVPDQKMALTRDHIMALGRHFMESLNGNFTRGLISRPRLIEDQDAHRPDATWSSAGFAGAVLASRLRDADGTLERDRAAAALADLENVLPSRMIHEARVRAIEIYPAFSGCQKRADEIEQEGVKGVRGFYDRGLGLLVCSIEGDSHNFYHELAHSLDHKLTAEDWQGVSREWAGGKPENFATGFASWCMAARRGPASARSFQASYPAIEGVMRRLGAEPATMTRDEPANSLRAQFAETSWALDREAIFAGNEAWKNEVRDRQGRWTSGSFGEAQRRLKEVQDHILAEPDPDRLPPASDIPLLQPPSGPEEMPSWLAKVREHPYIAEAHRLVERAKREGATTGNLFWNPDANKGKGDFIPERKKLHSRIMAQMFNPKAKAAKNEQPQITFVMGAPASGKTSMGRSAAYPQMGISRDRVTVLDPDEVKARLPEYRGWNAALVHDESAEVFDRIMERAVRAKHHILFDTTGRDQKFMEDMVGKFHKAGYKIHLVHTHVSSEIAAYRAADRFMRNGFRRTVDPAEMGRYVPIDYVYDNVDSKPDIVFDQLSKDERVSSWTSYNANDLNKPYIRNGRAGSRTATKPEAA